MKVSCPIISLHLSLHESCPGTEACLFLIYNNMLDIIRDSLFGQAVRMLSHRKVFLYPEEKPAFEADRYYKATTIPQAQSETLSPLDREAATPYNVEYLRVNSGSSSKCCFRSNRV